MTIYKIIFELIPSIIFLALLKSKFGRPYILAVCQAGPIQM